MMSTRMVKLEGIKTVSARAGGTVMPGPGGVRKEVKRARIRRCLDGGLAQPPGWCLQQWQISMRGFEGLWVHFARYCPLVGCCKLSGSDLSPCRW